MATKKPLERTRLSDYEMSVLDKRGLEQKLEKKEILEYALKKEVLKLRKQLLQTQIESLSKDEKILELEQFKVLEGHNSSKSRHELFVKKLSKELGLQSEKFSFDPDTGELQS